MYITDLVGNDYPLQATITQELELNGNQSLNMRILPSKVNLTFLNELTELWEITDHDDITYKIVYLKKQGEGNSLSAEIKAIPKIFDDLDTQRIYEEYNQSMTANYCFNLIFSGSGYNFVLVDTFNAISWEGFGQGDTRLTLFKNAINRYGAEFRISGNTVYLESRIGRDTQFMYRYRLNASNIIQENDASAYWTYAKGYGDFSSEDGYQGANLVREYTSPIANIIGIREAPPIKNGNITTTSTMDEQLKTLVDESLKISVSATIHDLRKQGYELAQPELGDRVFLIDERIGLNEEVRIVDISIVRNWKNEVIDLKLTFGSPNIVKRHQSNLQTAITDIKDLIEGRRKLPFSVLDNAVAQATKDLQAAQTELSFSDNGILAVDKGNPNYVTLFNSAGLGVSDDGGATFGQAITGKGIVADYIVSGTLRSIIVDAVEIYGSRIEGTDVIGSTFLSEQGTSHTKIENSYLENKGEHRRIWWDYNQMNDVRILLEDGQIRARNDTLDWSLYFSDWGISTFSDGSGNEYDEVASGAIEFHSTRYHTARGLTLFSGARLGLETNGGRIYLNPNGASVRVASADDSTHYSVTASDFNTASSVFFKKNIDEYQENATELIKQTPVREYHFKEDIEDIDPKRIGLIVQESPRDIVNLDGGDSINLYAMASLLWKSVQELTTRIEVLENGTETTE